MTDKGVDQKPIVVGECSCGSPVFESMGSRFLFCTKDCDHKIVI
jgi:hypothetical protein